MKKCILAAVLLAMLVCLSTGNAADTTKVFGTKGTGIYSYVKTTSKTANVFPNFGKTNTRFNAKTTYRIMLSRSNSVEHDLRANDGGMVTTPVYHTKGTWNHTETSYTVSLGAEAAEAYSVNTQVASSMAVGGDAFGFQYSVDTAATDGYCQTTTKSLVISKSTNIVLELDKEVKTAFYAYCYGTPYRQYRTDLTITSSYGTVKEILYYNLPTKTNLARYFVYSRDCETWSIAR